MRQDLSLDDAAYRFLIKCRIAKNHMTGTAPNMEEVLDFIFPGNAAVLDHYDMSYTVFVSTAMISDVIRHAITTLDILPRPAGVRVRYNLVTHLPFGYERSNRNYTRRLWRPARAITHDRTLLPYPFAHQGDMIHVPEAKDSHGFVSYTQGWGPDYQKI
ncbi:DUF2612 domain-containing protein [Xylella fastidiosa]|uniref:DUF2612 domain-containing protein n=1 Tax=Xylella fastidiosa TaxID=2371 RepID=UPI0034E03864